MNNKSLTNSREQSGSRLLNDEVHFNLDQAIKEVGGFGIYQWLLVTCLIIMRNGGNYLYYGFGMLIMENDYLCRTSPDDQWAACTLAEVCSAPEIGPFEHKIDVTSFNYVRNWLLQMDMECAPKTVVGSMIACYSVTAGISGLFLFSLPNKWGRIKTMRVFGGLSVLAQLIIIFVPNLHARQFGFGLLGLSQLKNGVSYVWMFEGVESNIKSTVCGIMNTFDTITLAIMSVYFMYEPNWFYLQLTMTSLCALSYVILMTVMPESAKWCLIQGNMEGALASFDTMAKINRSKTRLPKESVFIEFLIARNDDTASFDAHSPNLTHNSNNVTAMNRSVMAKMQNMSMKATSIHKIRGQAPALSRKGKKTMSQGVVFVLLLLVYTFAYFQSWMLIFGTSQEAGPKLMHGVVFGVAEACSCLTSGLIVRSIKDSTAVVIFCFTGSVAAITYYWMKGAAVGELGSIALFIEVFSTGAIISLTYVLVELRVPPESFAPTTVLCVTAALLCSALAQLVASAEGIIPTVIIVSIFALMGFFTFALPPGG
jgi:hypothetical protein